MNKRKFDHSKISHYTFEKKPPNLSSPQKTEKTTEPLVCLLEVKPSFPWRKVKPGEEYFRRYNFFAYSFPENSLNISTIFNLIDQIFLYLKEKTKAKDTDLPETAICLLLEKKPETLLRQLKQSKIEVEEKCNGIYYAHFSFHFKIIVSEELPEYPAAQVNKLIRYLEQKHR